MVQKVSSEYAELLARRQADGISLPGYDPMEKLAQEAVKFRPLFPERDWKKLVEKEARRLGIVKLDWNALQNTMNANATDIQSGAFRGRGVRPASATQIKIRNRR